ncbi:hypothetical protein SNE40_009842 [Patella caerulea]|uniref:Major facilitator superfamily (MFS) profile domain-containing protein n=1 Tax=Patella caerulea TaxID=87958 RepID=A0AAN8JZS6_PATCE
MEGTPLLQSQTAQKPSSSQGNLKNLILINVVILLVSIGTCIMSIVLPQYVYKRVGEELYSNVTLKHFKNQSLCFRNISDPNYKIQVNVQETTSDRLTQLILFNSIPAIFTVAILGAYVDYLGRKTILIMALFGHFARNLCLTLVALWNLSIDYMYLYIGFGLDAICGGFCALLLLGYVFTADHTQTSESRTFAMGVLAVSNGLASCLGYILTGYLIERLGFFYPMLISSLLNCISLGLTVIFVSETLERRPNSCISPQKGLSNVFGFYYSKVYDGRRGIFWLAMLGFLFSVISTVGGSNIMTLFVFDSPLCWDPIKLGWYNTVGMGVINIFGMATLRLMQVFFSEGTIALIGSISIAAYDIYLGFCYTDWMLYCAPLFALFSFGTYPVIRSIISQMVTKERQGSIFASIAFIEAMCYASGSPVFSYIYKATVGNFKGAVFQVMAAMHFIAFIMYLLLIKRRNSYSKRQELALSIQAADEDTMDSYDNIN